MICWSFGGTFCDRLVYFSRFGILYREKSGNPDGKPIHLEIVRSKREKIAKKTKQICQQTTTGGFEIRASQQLLSSKFGRTQKENAIQLCDRAFLVPWKS
jgi:hypothetical protein